MKAFFIRISLCIIIVLIFAGKSVGVVDAIYDPREVPNNPAGIHILFTEELEAAARLVNTSGGDWGYVTIPIQSNDRDLAKWQKFMDDAKERHLIPIVRLATEPYRYDTSVWRKPNGADILDFANFLDSLSWPTKNRYIILFNEINRFDEWQGEAPSPAEYADLVSYAGDVFKRKHEDFFVILGGLDNASPNDRVKYMDNFVFLREMGEHNPEVFNKIDGLSSHSYPNPGFAQPPSAIRAEGTATYKFENQIIREFSGEEKPVFITETGWDVETVGEDLSFAYLVTAFNTIWNVDRNVVAVTPFLLESNDGPFTKFTFIKNGQITKMGEALQVVRKRLGRPHLNSEEVKSANTAELLDEVKGAEFAYAEPVVYDAHKTPRVLKSYFKAILGVN